MTYQGIFKKAKENALQKLTEYYEKKYTPEKACEKAQGIIEKLLVPAEKYNIRNGNPTLSDVYVRLLLSCQNRVMMPNVIKFDNPNTQKNFKQVLPNNDDGANYDYKKIAQSSSDKIFEEFAGKFGLNKDSKNELWHSFAESVVDAAKFIKRFKSVEDFKNSLEIIANRFPCSMALPRLISGEIRGMGEALACDFLKEIGCIEYAKPDEHIRVYVEKIINNFKDEEDKNYKKLTNKQILDEMQKMAEENNVTSFAMDKILWLVASGKYYDPDGEEPMIKIKNNKNELRNEFLETLKKVCLLV